MGMNETVRWRWAQVSRRAARFAGDICADAVGFAGLARKNAESGLGADTLTIAQKWLFATIIFSIIRQNDGSALEPNQAVRTAKACEQHKIKKHEKAIKACLKFGIRRIKYRKVLKKGGWYRHLQRDRQVLPKMLRFC